MSIYSDKLAYEQVVINRRYFDAPTSTSEEILARYLSAPLDDVMSENELTTKCFRSIETV